MKLHNSLVKCLLVIIYANKKMKAKPQLDLSCKRKLYTNYLSICKHRYTEE